MTANNYLVCLPTVVTLPLLPGLAGAGLRTAEPPSERPAVPAIVAGRLATGG